MSDDEFIKLCKSSKPVKIICDGSPEYSGFKIEFDNGVVVEIRGGREYGSDILNIEEVEPKK